jgi:hypothetical protein
MNNLLLVGFVLGAGYCSAQVVPTTPTRFGKAGLGASSGSSSASLSAPNQRPETVVRTTTYVALSAARQWTSSDGRPLVGKLIAFEDLVSEALKSQSGTQPTAPPVLAGKPTVIRSGQIRLLVNNQAYTLKLDSLMPADREFATGIANAVAASPTKPASP